MNTLKLFAYIAIQVIIVFGVAIAWTFFTDYLNTTTFFGDVPCTEKWINEIKCGIMDQGRNWAIRHYLYFWMSFILFCLNVIRVIVSVVLKVDEEIK